MAGELGYTVPTNKIIVFNPYAKLPTQTCKVQTATNMIPGHLVKRNSTSDADIIVNTAANTPIGWLGYEETNPKYTTLAATAMAITDAYAVDAIPAVHNGPGVVWKGWLADGQTCYKGSELVAAANGEMSVAASISLTETASSKHHSASAGSIPVGGSVIAIAEMYAAPSGAKGAIAARSLI
jgi:hypothetical protein